MAPGSAVLARSVTRNARRLAVGTGLISLHQVCEAGVPILIGIGVDRAVAPGDAVALVWWVVALALLFTALTMCYRFGARQLMVAIAGEGYRLRGELAAKILHPRGIRTEKRPGELLSISSTDADNVSYLLDYIPRIAGAVTATVVAAVTLLLIDPTLGLAVLVGTPLVLVALQVAAPLITRRVEDQQEIAGQATALATDLLQGLRPLRGLGAEPAAARRYRAVSRASLAAALRAARTHGGYLAASTTCSGLLACAVALLAGWFALTGRIGLGELITVIGLAQFLLEPMGLLAIVPSWVAEARASANRVALVLDADPVLPDATAAVPPGPLRLADVRYGPLTGVDLAVAPGEFVGVVAYRLADGEALVRLLSGRVDPAEYTGAVRLGDAELPTLDPAHARAHVLVEPHRTDLFTGTVAANLGVEEPAAALAASAADQVVAEHPDGLDLVLTERGTSLSGGQRQRLALARALAAQAPVLVLHDPTTAVDAVTEHAIARGVRALRGGDRSTLVITSSPALLAVTDRVVVLDGGRVTAEGRHDELSAVDAGYRQAVLR